MDEKKRMVGGKLEVKVRVRNPIVAKQLEKVTERWLVIDGFWGKWISSMKYYFNVHAFCFYFLKLIAILKLLSFRQTGKPI